MEGQTLFEMVVKDGERRIQVTENAELDDDVIEVQSETPPWFTTLRMFEMAHDDVKRRVPFEPLQAANIALRLVELQVEMDKSA